MCVCVCVCVCVRERERERERERMYKIDTQMYNIDTHTMYGPGPDIQGLQRMIKYENQSTQIK
jgi:hypothetical protein